MVKTLKNLLFQNHKSYDLETWHVASRTQVLQSLYIFTARSNEVTEAFATVRVRGCSLCVRRDVCRLDDGLLLWLS